MARQEVKPSLKFGFQVYRQFVCEEGFQDFCVGPILIAKYTAFVKLPNLLKQLFVFCYLFFSTGS